eukprot:gene15843-33405_t
MPMLFGRPNEALKKGDVFVLSKLMSAITQPMFWLAVWWAVALLLLGRSRRVAVRMLWAGLVVLGLLGFKAVPNALLRSLENQYPVPAQEAMDRHVGVIVLGGAFDHPDVYQAHGQVPLGDAASSSAGLLFKTTSRSS